ASGRFARVTVAGLGTSGSLARAEGSALLRQELALADGGVAFRAGARLQPFVGAGAGLYRLRVHGTGTAPLFASLDDRRGGAAVDAGGGVAGPFGRRVSLLAEAGALAIFPRTRVLIAGQEAGRAGGLTLLAALGLLATF